MQKIKIITDSACDLTKQDASEQDILILPVPITVDGKGYLEGINLTKEEFFDILENADRIPTTSHVTSLVYLDEFEKAQKEGYTDIIVVTVTSTASNMFNSATKAKELFYEDTRNTANIHVIDSQCFSLGYGYPVYMAGKMIKENKSIDEILEYLNDWFETVDVYFSAFSLEYAKKSGRIGVVSAFIGDILGLHPIICATKGKFKVIDKARGKLKVVEKLTKIIKDNKAEGAPYIILAGQDKEPALAIKNKIKEELGEEPFGIYTSGPAITINSGPKIIGIAFKAKGK